MQRRKVLSVKVQSAHMDSSPDQSPISSPAAAAVRSPETIARSAMSCCKKRTFTRKEVMRCFFCGGENCPKCGLNAHQSMTSSPPAIPGLHSHWINDSIVAMQRPSDAFLVNNRGIQRLIDAKISAVFNLTEPGEHPYCGAGLIEDSGFPYSPERLMEAGIKHFNYSWPDMTVPKIALMMNIVHVAGMEISRGGKIAVHCHAGFGRTGVAVACIMIVNDQLESTQVINFVRKRRPGSIQTAAQEKFVKKFERAFALMMQVFPTSEALDLLKTQPHSDSSSTTTNANATTAASSTAAAATASSLSSASPRNNNSSGSSSSGSFTSTSFSSSAIAHASLYQKSIRQTAEDQALLLSTAEAQFSYMRYLHKLVYFSTVALGALAQQEYNIACLALTGLTKLVPKNNNWDLDFESISSKLAPSSKSFRAKSFMVVTNSLSEVSEEKIMDDIKAEVNKNKWTRFMSVGDVVAGALRMSQESVKQMNRLTERVQSFKRDRSFLLSNINNSSNSGVATAGSSSSGTQRRSFDSASARAAAVARAAATVAAAASGSSSNNNSKTHSSSNLNRSGSNRSSNNNSNSNSNSNADGSGGSRVVKMSSSRFRQNSLLENTDKDYNKSKKVASNTMAQLLLDWIETRCDCCFDSRAVDALTDIWTAHYPNIGKIGSSNAMRADILSGSDTSLALYNDVNDFLQDELDKYKLYLLSAVVKLYKHVRMSGVQSSATAVATAANTTAATTAVHANATATAATAANSNSAVSNSSNTVATAAAEVPAMDILVGVRLSIALLHATKAYPGLIRHRSLNMEIVKIFILKHADEERVLINNINFAQEHYDTVVSAVGEKLVTRLDTVLRTLELLLESDWKFSINDQERVQWDEARISSSNHSNSSSSGSNKGGNGSSGSSQYQQQQQEQEQHGSAESSPRLENTVPRDLYTIEQSPFSNSMKSIA